MPDTNFKPAILVVEDDTLIRMLGVDLLEEAGFEVWEAANADDAVAILSDHSDVRLLFSDVDMPGSMNGMDLARLVHERWPHIRLLITSGHHRLSDAAIPDDGEFVGKPWTADGLVGKIREMLNS